MQGGVDLPYPLQFPDLIRSAEGSIPVLRKRSCDGRRICAGQSRLLDSAARRAHFPPREGLRLGDLTRPRCRCDLLGLRLDPRVGNKSFRTVSDAVIHTLWEPRAFGILAIGVLWLLQRYHGLRKSLR